MTSCYAYLIYTFKACTREPSQWEWWRKSTHSTRRERCAQTTSCHTHKKYGRHFIITYFLRTFMAGALPQADSTHKYPCGTFTLPPGGTRTRLPTQIVHRRQEILYCNVLWHASGLACGGYFLGWTWHLLSLPYCIYLLLLSDICLVRSCIALDNFRHMWLVESADMGSADTESPLNFRKIHWGNCIYAISSALGLSFKARLNATLQLHETVKII